ncbi:hypothetical protein HYY75_02430 [bacterium]|nr:hypothetical protein [bacterium]
MILKRTKQRGMAIAIVLIFALSMSILGMFILRNTQQHYRENLKTANQLQAYFVAKAGLEHALLKIKYLPRELYDAACLSQGRNPLYDFSKGLGGITDYNPGPIFLFKSGEATPIPGSFFTPNIDSISANIPPGMWLSAYKADVSSGKTIDSVLINGVMSMAPLPNEVAVHILSPPFGGQYELSELKVLANRVDPGTTVSNQAIIELTVTGIINNSGVPAGNVHYENWTETLKRTVKVSREN